MQKFHSIGLNLRCLLAPMVLFLTLSGFEPAGAFEISTNNVNVLGREIKVYLYKPDGAGPFPLLILSHGSPRNAEERVQFGAQTFHVQAKAYVADGVAVAVPIRRGYGGNGKWVEGFGPCEHPDYYDAGLPPSPGSGATSQRIQSRLHEHELRLRPGENEMKILIINTHLNYPGLSEGKLPSGKH